MSAPGRFRQRGYRWGVAALCAAVSVTGGVVTDTATASAPTVTHPATASASAVPSPPVFPSDPTALVNTSIGNNGSGTTFPGAAVPFGMVQNSPDTRLNSYASYDYEDTEILGFSQTHLSGVGCQTMGDIRLMPTVGGWPGTSPQAQASTFSHDNEQAEPGYYRVRLDSGIQAELSASTRTGWHRYTYPDAANRRTVVVNVGSANGYTYDGHVEVVDDDTVEGWITGGNFCWETGKERYKVFFSAKFDHVFDAFGTWSNGSDVAAGQRVAEIGGSSSNGSRSDGGAMLTFSGGNDHQVGTAVGLSYTSVEGARRNRAAESPFDEVRQRAHNTWRKQLSRLQVAGGEPEDLRTFYSALYRSLLHPSVGSDVDGRYMGFDKQIHTSRTPYYQMFSLWDTYRSQNQLVALLEPQRARDMAASILRVYEDGGWLPRWALGPSETNVMSGEGVTPFITTLYSRGVLGEELARKLFNALWRNVNQVPADQSIFRGRDGNPTYVESGWIGYQDLGGYTWGDTRQAGSATLEYALADCGLALMARGLGEVDKAAALQERCTNFSKIWDFGIDSKGFNGFPRSRAADGSWVGSSDPTQSTGFHEGTAWQYQWLAQQDIPTLFALMGGSDNAESRLDTFFDMPKVLSDPQNVARESWVVGAYDYHNNFAFNPNNEPDLHSPWIYAWTDDPWKTSAVLRAAQPLFTDDAYGMPGNDDLGTISSWMIFSMIGIFEVMPGSGEYVLSAPMFDRVKISPDGGKSIEIHAPGATSERLQYVDEVHVGRRGVAKEWHQSWISHHDLLSSREVWFDLTEDPASTTWGTGAENHPPSHGDAELGTIPFASTDVISSPVLLKPGETVDVTVGAVNLTQDDVDVAYSASPPQQLSVTPTSGTFTAAAADRGSVDLAVTVGESTPTGVYSVPVSMTDADTGESLGSVTVAIKVPRLPHSGNWMWYSGMKNNMNATLTRSVSVPAAGTTTLDAWLLYETEPGYDYIYGEVSTDGGATWQRVSSPLDGSSNGWREESWDLTPFAGHETLFRLRYSTDSGVVERGVYVDDFSVATDGEVIWSDDVETGDAGWQISEFSRVEYALID